TSPPRHTHSRLVSLERRVSGCLLVLASAPLAPHHGFTCHCALITRIWHCLQAILPHAVISVFRTLLARIIMLNVTRSYHPNSFMQSARCSVPTATPCWSHTFLLARVRRPA